MVKPSQLACRAELYAFYPSSHNMACTGSILRLSFSICWNLHTMHWSNALNNSAAQQPDRCHALDEGMVHKNHSRPSPRVNTHHLVCVEGSSSHRQQGAPVAAPRTPRAWRVTTLTLPRSAMQRASSASGPDTPARAAMASRVRVFGAAPSSRARAFARAPLASCRERAAFASASCKCPQGMRQVHLRSHRVQTWAFVPNAP